MSEGVFVRPVGASLGLRARLLGIVLLLTGIAVAVLASPVGAQAADNVNVRIMTRNLYLGADLSPAINASTTNEFVDANGQIVRDVDTNNFPVRAKGLAQEILQQEPDLVGLQEVALWRYGPLNDSAPFTCNGVPDDDSPFGCDFTASTVRYDFLRDLLRELNKDKQRYRVVISQKEFDFEAPTDYNGVAGRRRRLPGPVRRRGERSPDDARRHPRPHRPRDDDERQGRPLRASVRTRDRRHPDRARPARLDPGGRDGSKQPQVPVRQHPPGGVRRPDDPSRSGAGAGPAGRSGHGQGCR